MENPEAIQSIVDELKQLEQKGCYVLKDVIEKTEAMLESLELDLETVDRRAAARPAPPQPIGEDPPDEVVADHAEGRALLGKSASHHLVVDHGQAVEADDEQVRVAREHVRVLADHHSIDDVRHGQAPKLTKAPGPMLVDTETRRM